MRNITIRMRRGHRYVCVGIYRYGKRMQREFSINRLGEDEAMRLAQQAVDEFERDNPRLTPEQYGGSRAPSKRPYRPTIVSQMQLWRAK